MTWKREIYAVFTNLREVYDKVSRELWGFLEDILITYVLLIKDMLQGSWVECNDFRRDTNNFYIDIVLHHESA